MFFCLFGENDDPITVGAACVVLHAPAICSFCEVLRVDESILDLQASSLSSQHNLLFQFELSFPYFADFERNATVGFKHAGHFFKGSGHLLCPIFQLAKLPELPRFWLTLAKPIAQPVVAHVVDDI